VRTFTLMINTTLDAQVAGPGGDLEWFRSDEEVEAAHLDVLRSADAMVFGRVAYDELAAYWPTAGASTADDAPGGFSSDERADEFARLVNAVPKVVLTREPDRALPWGPARAIGGGDAAAALRGFKAEEGGDVVLFAGAQMAVTAIDAEVLDELRLFVHPIVLGKGVPLFGNLRQARTFELVSATTFPSKVVELRYSSIR
jgi:dihydrofolate reductase